MSGGKTVQGDVGALLKLETKELTESLQVNCRYSFARHVMPWRGVGTIRVGVEWVAAM